MPRSAPMLFRRVGLARRVYPRKLDSHKFILLEHGTSTSDRSSGGQKRRDADDERSSWRESGFKLVEGSATALGSVVILGLAGYSYHEFYKSLVLSKMENAFAVGYSSLELAALGRRVPPLRNGTKAQDQDDDSDNWIPREEQATINGIVDGSTQGQYHLVTGEKGTGKTSMILEAMRKINGEGVAMLEAHADLEVFRVRLGKALDYEFHEDYIGSLFAFRGPRDTTPLLDIERAFNKMEKVALKRREEVGKPIVLIINGVHLLRNDADGQDLLELLQQRAELWAASSLVTVVLNSDDHWITERLMWQATRLRVLPVHDIPKDTVLTALKDFRARKFHEDTPMSVLRQVYDQIGGRLRFLSRVARSHDMVDACQGIYEREKRWLLSQCWIMGPGMDDDAEDQQQYCVSVWLLAKALVEKEKTSGTSEDHGGKLPQIPVHEAGEIMTRADFVQKSDHINLITIDSNGMVQADSVAMQNAFREICRQEGFDERLQATMGRLDELESLRRTRELTFKDFPSNGKCQAIVENSKVGINNMVISFSVTPSKTDKI